MPTSTPTPQVHAEPALIGKHVTVVYRIDDPTEWRKTNPLNYAHNGMKAVAVSIGDLTKRRDDLRSALERIADDDLDGTDADEVAKQALDEDDAKG